MANGMGGCLLPLADVISVALPVLQVDNAKSLHYIGAGVAFPAGLLFVCLQCVLSYHVASSVLDFWMAHLRVFLATVALIALVLSILFFTGTRVRKLGSNIPSAHKGTPFPQQEGFVNVFQKAGPANQATCRVHGGGEI